MTDDPQMQPSRRALRWLFIAFGVVFVGNTVLFLRDGSGTDGSALFFMCASASAFG
jgi:hypothetical protein